MGNRVQVVQGAVNGLDRVALLHDAYGAPLTLDAFGRLRVAGLETIFDSKQIVNAQELFWTTGVTGSGVVGAHSRPRASTELSVGTAPGFAVRQTRRRFNYQPGKSQLIVMTFNPMSTSPGVSQNIGLFDDANGVMLRFNGNEPEFVVRSSVGGSAVENVITRRDWNVNQLDHVSQDTTLRQISSNIFWCDIEWLGVGSNRFGFVIGGKFVVCHQEEHANRLNSVYMSTPNLPLRYEVRSEEMTAGGGAMETICASVASEGGANPTGITTNFSAPDGQGVGSSFEPLVQVRHKAGFEEITSYIELVETLTTDANADYEWAVFFNPTYAGGTEGPWISAGAGSALEYEVALNTTITGSEHRSLGGYGQSGVIPGQANFAQALALGLQLDGTRDRFVLAARSLANDQIYGSMTMRELL